MVDRERWKMQWRMTPARIRGLSSAAEDRVTARRWCSGVYQMLLTRISRGDYQPDEKLPGEHELRDSIWFPAPSSARR